MRMSGRWFKQIVIVVVVLGLLTLAWPSVAQSERPVLNLQQLGLLEQRFRQPDQFLDTLSTGLKYKPNQVNLGYSSPYQPTGTDPRLWTKITFASYRTSDWEIYAANGDGSLPQRITYSPSYDGSPRFNQAGTRIAFVSKRDGHYEIYTMNADGSNQKRLTASNSNKYGPTWSPDGTQIAFYDDANNQANIWAINADGSNLRQLTFFNSWDGHPAWSPDGSKIAYISTGTGVYELWIMDADGSNQTRVYYAQYGLLYPSWSPDGSKLIFNISWGGDGFFDIGTGAPDGTQFAIIASISTTTDLLAPVWDPSGQFFAFTKINWIYYQGNWYWTDAYVVASDMSGSTAWPLTDSGEDWWVSWKSQDTTPPTSSTNSPIWSNSTNFVVTWSGSDPGQSGIATYDVQYSDGSIGVWTDWQIGTQSTFAEFTGQAGHTYYFRSRARDYANNLEAYPGGNGDTSTTVYQHSLTGQILGNREQPVTVASIAANPTALNTSYSRHDGQFDLYFASGGTYTLTTTRNGFGILPPLRNINVPPPTSLPTLYLPPLDDQLSAGHFESGTLSAWNPTGDLTPTITSTAHTGNYAVVLGGIVPSATISSGPYLSTIEQTITVPLTLTDGTLSLLYKVNAADPFSDTLTVYLIAAADSLTFTLPVTATDWTHHWFDVSTWTSPTATLRVELATLDAERTVGVSVDEITWGSSIIGSRPIYLPIMRR